MAVSYTHLDVYKRQVQMALDKINSDNICELDDERKAQMVSNLLVVLCGNQNAQPVDVYKRQPYSFTLKTS